MFEGDMTKFRTRVHFNLSLFYDHLPIRHSFISLLNYHSLLVNLSFISLFIDTNFSKND